jgi:alkylhydroperoxidase/carboxymuconolactone decarboxylase family protein YurZ
MDGGMTPSARDYVAAVIPFLRKEIASRLMTKKPIEKPGDYGYVSRGVAWIEPTSWDVSDASWAAINVVAAVRCKRFYPDNDSPYAVEFDITEVDGLVIGTKEGEVKRLALLYMS